MADTTKTLAVAAIRNGTVIDHISAGHALKIVKLLKLAGHQQLVTLGLNLPSALLEYKDIIKVEGRELTPDEANQVAVFAPNASINIITEYEVSKKFKVSIPDMIESVIPCPNPRCISNHEEAKSSLNVIRKVKKSIRLQCRYCRKIFTQKEIK